MTMLQITFLFIGFFILVLTLATIFKRHQRTIFWTAAICMFLGVLFTVGFGLVDTVKDNRPNMPVVTTITMVLVGSATLIIGTEKHHRKLREKENEAQHSSSFEPPVLVPASETSVVDKESGVLLTGTLKTELAEKVYAKAIEAGFMKEQGAYYKWNESKVLLAYMCGRIYCGDKPEQSKFDEKPFWKFGRQGVFPDTE